MPDTILSVEFASDGAPVSAPAGSYPIRPSAIRFQGDARVRYSLRYVPGTMVVGTSAPIAFVRKAQFSVPTPSGGVVWSLPVAPTVGNTLVLFVGSSAITQAAPGFSTPTTGDDSAYTQVGGFGYQAEIVYTGGGGSDFVIAAFTRKVGGGGSEGDVKITFSDPGGGFPNVELVILEYSHVAASAVSAFVKAEVGEGSEVRPNPMPPLALNGTAGQCVVCAMVASVGLPGAGGVGPTVPSGYAGRYSMAGATDTNGLDINTVDRVGLSGLGPQTVSYDWTPGSTSRGYAGIALALTKG